MQHVFLEVRLVSNNVVVHLKFMVQVWLCSCGDQLLSSEHGTIALTGAWPAACSDYSAPPDVGRVLQIPAVGFMVLRRVVQQAHQQALA
jgi:hypothetical protein